MSGPESVFTAGQFAKSLTELRLRAGLTIREVTAASGLRLSTVGGWFKGRTRPPATQQKAFVRVLRACGVTDDEEIQRWLNALGRARTAAKKRASEEVENPYRGLKSFAPEDRALFCGRDSLIEALVSRVADRVIAGGALAVIGPSGSGKSSLLRAGLVAALRQGAIEGSSSWSVRPFTPGARPLDELVAQFADTETDLDAVRDMLLTDPTTAVDLALRAPDIDGRDPGRRLVLVVDQLEELFAPDVAQGDRVAFVSALAAAANQVDETTEQPAALVVFGLRADFFDRALRLPGLAAVLNQGSIAVGPMTTNELAIAIQGPVAAVGGDVGEGLVELVLEELRPPPGNRGVTNDLDALGHEPGALPFLSHALRAAWDADRPHNRITVDAYNEVGGVRGAIAQTAETLYQGLADGGRDLARMLFLRLVRVATDTQDTRRRMTYDDLVDTSDPARSDAVIDVLETFIEGRLITTLDSNRVEITHDAVLTAWPRLRGWISDDRVGLAERVRLADAARVWRDTDNDPDILYRGGQLGRANAWKDEHPDELTNLEKEFLGVATELRDAEERAERDRRDAEERAERERREAIERAERERLEARARGSRRLLALATVAAVALGGIAVYAGVQQHIAVDQRNVAVSRAVASSANGLRNSEPALAAQLALAAYRVAPTAEARSSLLDTYSGPMATRALSPTGFPQTVAFNKDSSLMATGGADTSDTGVRLWSLADRLHPRLLTTQPLTGHSGPIYGLAFSPDGRILVSSGADQMIRSWDISNPAVPRPLGGPVSGPSGTVYSVAYTADGRILAVGGADHLVRLYDTADPAVLRPLGQPLSGPAGEVQTLAFSPTSTLLAVGSHDGTIRFWDLHDPLAPTPVGRPLANLGSVLSITFSPDGHTLAAGGAQKNVRFWNVVNPAAPIEMGPALTGPNGLVNSVALSPDGSTVAVASSDNRVWVWNLRSREVLATLPHPGPATAVRFLSNDGATLATSAADGATRIWTLPGPVITEPTDIVFTSQISSDGRSLLLGWDGSTLKNSTDQRTRLYDITDPRHPVPESPPLTAPSGKGLSGAAALSPDRRILAAGSLDGPAFLWNISDPAHPILLGDRLTGADGNIEAVQFSPDGNTLAVAGDDSRVRLWNVTDPQRPILSATLTQPQGYVYAIAFSHRSGLLAAASADKKVWVWDVTNPAHPVQLDDALIGPTKDIYSVAFSSDDRTLAAGSADKTVRLWDITDPRQPVSLGSPLIGPNNTVFWLAFSPNNRFLAAAGGDGTVWLWDLTDRAHPAVYATLTALSDPVWSVNFSPYGSILAAGGAATEARMWNTDPEQVASYICATTGDSITPQEWNKYLPGQDYKPPCL